jgi:hypothetical protein
MLFATTAACAQQSAPSTAWHYAPNSNIGSNGQYLPGSLGFNLADVSNKSTLDALPSGVKGLVWVGMCDGATPAFTTFVNTFSGDAKLFGFYLMDEPSPFAGQSNYCPITNLSAEADYVHSNLPGVWTFIVEENQGTPEQPNFVGMYTPTNSHVDLYGLDPYPAQKGVPKNFDPSIINKYVAAAEQIGLPLAQIVPVYQAFGKYQGGPWLLPTQSQENVILSTWGAALGSIQPVFEYAYSYGQQLGDKCISNTPYLQAVFVDHNAGG